MAPSKEKRKIQHRLGVLTRRHGRGACWICGSVRGVKTAREAFGTRCRGCMKNGIVNEDVLEHERLVTRLAKLNGARPIVQGV